MTLRNRVSVAAAIGVLIVVGSVSAILYVFYATNVRARVDSDLVNAAQQASAVAEQLKEAQAQNLAGPNAGTTPENGAGLSRPVSVGSIQLQVFPPPVVAGQSTRFGPLTTRDASIVDGA